jgi:glycosyltransferase involved in cell wall biosynthesis
MRKRIRILLAISDLRGGGAEREFEILARQLSRERFDAHLCFWRPIFTYPAPRDLPVHMLHKTRPWHVFRTIRDLRRLIRELRPQVIFSQLHYVNLVMGQALARVAPQPGWACRQVNDPRREMRGVFAAWARVALRRADRVLGCCDSVSQAMIDYLAVPRERIATLRNAVDVARIESLAREPLGIERAPGTFVVVHAGRFAPQKNQALLLRAVARGPRNLELWLLGEGPEEARLRSLAAELGIEARVRWLGFRANPYPYFRAADLFALTSDHEGLPNAVIEAMLCGAPVASTNCDYGPAELIEDRVTGRLTPVGDVEAFARALRDLGEAPERSAEMGRVAQARARRDFDTAVVCGEYEALFESLAREAAERSR